jgi:hypothetical protein
MWHTDKVFRKNRLGEASWCSRHGKCSKFGGVTHFVASRETKMHKMPGLLESSEEQVGMSWESGIASALNLSEGKEGVSE